MTINVNDVDEPPVLSGPDVVDYPENSDVADVAVAQYTAETRKDDTITWLTWRATTRTSSKSAGR